jgi:hypothetical protein
VPVFISVQMFEAPQPTVPARSSSSPRRLGPSSGLIEIELGHGR